MIRITYRRYITEIPLNDIKLNAQISNETVPEFGQVGSENA